MDGLGPGAGGGGEGGGRPQCSACSMSQKKTCDML